MKGLSNEIRAYALRNALEFGKADASKILPKLFQHGLDRKDIGKIIPEIRRIVSEINNFSSEEKEKEFEKYKEYAKEKKEEEKSLPELPEAGSRMVFRLAPFPSGALHIGNAKTYILNALYAEKYNGKTILVMDDTIGSEEKRIAPEAYKLIEEGFDWLGIKHEPKIIYKSDRLGIYYDYGEQLLKKGDAYICKCPQEELRKNRKEGKECSCRNLPLKEQEKRWREMFKAEQGSAVMRIKTSMKHPNPAFRDRVLFKISDREHPRVKNKYKVWPTLEMSWAIDDHLLGITHIIRGSDLVIESEMEKFIWEIFGWKHPVLIHTGLVKIEGIEGVKLSKSKAQKEVQSGEFSGWDDPRTWSLQSLKRRGIMPEAIREFVEEIGLNRQNITIPVEALYALNRRIIDSKADRYFFVAEPVELIIKNAPEVKEAEVPVHPDFPDKKRKIPVGKIFISMDDAKRFSGSEIRLLHLYNIKLGNAIKSRKINAEYSSSEMKCIPKIPKIQWVSSEIPAKVLMPDGKWKEGIAESSISRLKQGIIIQFERFGFCRCDKAGSSSCEFWFSHQ